MRPSCRPLQAIPKSSSNDEADWPAGNSIQIPQFKNHIVGLLAKVGKQFGDLLQPAVVHLPPMHPMPETDLEQVNNLGNHLEIGQVESIASPVPVMLVVVGQHQHDWQTGLIPREMMVAERHTFNCLDICLLLQDRLHLLADESPLQAILVTLTSGYVLLSNVEMHCVFFLALEWMMMYPLCF